MVTRAHGLESVKLHMDSASEVVIGGITRHSMNTATEVRREATSGDLYARFGAIFAQKPVATFATRSLEDALSNIAMAGLKIAGATNPGLVLYLKKQEEGGGRASGSVHRSATFKEGIIVPRRLTVDHQGDGEIEYEALITYDGTNDPLILTESVALPTAVADDERFTLPANMTIAGLTLSGVRRLEVDFGFEAEQIDADSDRWPTLARIKEINPSITLSGIDTEWFKASGAIDLDGVACTHANTSIFLRKREGAGGTGFVADGTTEHIKLTADGVAYVTTVDANGNELAEASLTIDCLWDGTNTPIVPTTGVAIV